MNPPQYAKNQPELCRIIAAELGVEITPRTLRNHLSRPRQPGEPAPPAPLRNGQLDVHGWLCYLRTCDYKLNDTDSATGASAPSPISRGVTQADIDGMHQALTEQADDLVRWLDKVTDRHASLQDRRSAAFAGITMCLERLVQTAPGASFWPED